MQRISPATVTEVSDLGDLIRATRKRRRLRQDDMEAVNGWGQSKVSRYEAGKIPYDAVNEVAEFIGRTPRWVREQIAAEHDEAASRSDEATVRKLRAELAEASAARDRARLAARATPSRPSSSQSPRRGSPPH